MTRPLSSVFICPSGLACGQAISHDLDHAHACFLLEVDLAHLPSVVLCENPCLWGRELDG